MTVQAKVTLRYGLLVVFMVAVISAVNMAVETDQQFETLRKRADGCNELAANMVKRALDADRESPLPDVLANSTLRDGFLDIMTSSEHAVVEISVVDSANTILQDSVLSLGDTLPAYDNFDTVVANTNWVQKLRILKKGHALYQVQSVLKIPPESLLYVRSVIDTALVKDVITPNLRKNLSAALIALIGAVCLTFLFSAFAFRPLGRLRRQLELVAAGDYTSEPNDPDAGKATDEFAIMSSKVNLLGERLRGAQFEVSDLRGNVERLFKDLEDAVFLFNRQQRLVFASGSVEKLLGRSRESLTGATLADIFPPSTTLGLVIADAAQTGKPIRNRRVPMTSEAEIPAGAPVVLLSIDAIQGAPGGAGLLVRLRDPEAQRKIGRQLQIADRLTAISKVSGGVAHEVKNPLNAILLHVEVARAKLSVGNVQVDQEMEIIAREILRLDRVVKTFLDFTRPVELSLSTTPLRGLVDEIVELARPQAQASKIRIEVTQQVEGIEVRVDRDLIKQAVLNVVVNGMQAMSPVGGELRFESSATPEAAEIRISDTGPGIPPELREKIFRLYFTTRKEGSGIGLAMTFRIVQLHDGTIDFTSEPGKGTTFLIRLPVVGQE
jgi:signal transduction histidine kinase